MYLLTLNTVTSISLECDRIKTICLDKVVASIEKTKTVEDQKAIWENRRGFKYKKQEQKSNKSQLGFDGQKTEPRCHDDATDCARILSHPFIDSHVYQTKHQDNQSKDSCFISRIYYFTCTCVFDTCLSCHGRSHTRHDGPLSVL